MFEFLQSIGDKVFTEAGVLAFVLFWLSVYLLFDNKGLRKENRVLNDKLFDLGVKQTAAGIETNNILDKLGDTVEAVLKKLEELVGLVKKDMKGD